MNSAIWFHIVLICQSFYSLYYALNREQNELHKETLFNFSVNVFGSSVQNCPLDFWYIKLKQNEQNTESLNIIFSLDFFCSSHFYIYSIFLYTFATLFFSIQLCLLIYFTHFAFTFTVLFNNCIFWRDTPFKSKKENIRIASLGVFCNSEPFRKTFACLNVLERKFFYFATLWLCVLYNFEMLLDEYFLNTQRHKSEKKFENILGNGNGTEHIILK